MTPGRLSLPSEFTTVPSHGSIFVYIIPPQNVIPARVIPACHPGESSRSENFTPVRNLATVSRKRETTTRFGVKSVCR